MRTYAKIVLLLAALNLTGCGTGLVKNLAEVEPCCTDLSKIKYADLTYKKEITSTFGSEESQARVFPEGKSFFMPVKLPEFKGPYEIQIKGSPNDKEIVLPRILLLNDKFQIAKKIASTKFHFDNGYASYKFFLNADRGYRYMILYTAPQDLGKESVALRNQSYTTPIIAGPYMFYYTVGAESEATIKSSDRGTVAVKALQYKPRILDQKS